MKTLCRRQGRRPGARKTLPESEQGIGNAEHDHAVVPDSSDPLRNTRTTHANFLERLFIAPYYVNYHLEHHLLFYIPCYNLPRVHRILSQSDLAGRMETQPNYLAVLRLATGKPNQQDRPGQLVNSLRRAQAGQAVGGDQKASGF